MSRLDLDAIRQRAEEATPGPWGVHGDYGLWSDGAGVWVMQDDCLPGGTLGGADAEFIARARTDVPALLAEVERLTRERDEARAALVVDDAMVKRAMRASWHLAGCCDECVEDHLANAKEEAAMRAALEAALEGGR